MKLLQQIGLIAKLAGQAFLFPWVMGFSTLLWLFGFDHAADALHDWWLHL